MIFEDALAAARSDLTNAPVPAFAKVEAAVRWRESGVDARRPPLRARWLATLGAVLASTVMATDAAIGVRLGVPLVAALLLPVVLLGLSAVLVHRPGLGGQVVSRAVWWTYLVLGAAWSLGPAESLPAAGTLLTLGCGFSLLCVGRDGLRRADTVPVFDPIAFRGSVLLSMILGLSGAGLMTLAAAVEVESAGAPGRAVALLSCAALLGVGVWGLSRLRVWAVVLNLSVNLLVVVVLLLALDEWHLLMTTIAALAAIQLVLPARMLVAFFRGAPPTRGGGERPARLAVAVIVAMMLGSIPLGLWGTYADLLPRSEADNR